MRKKAVSAVFTIAIAITAAVGAAAGGGLIEKPPVKTMQVQKALLPFTEAMATAGAGTILAFDD